MTEQHRRDKGTLLLAFIVGLFSTRYFFSTF
ncbi:Uncharacterised protein [Morganella morganii]|nr:Uncharacterised protein [Morganella morganii]